MPTLVSTVAGASAVLAGAESGGNAAHAPPRAKKKQRIQPTLIRSLSEADPIQANSILIPKPSENGVSPLVSSTLSSSTALAGLPGGNGSESVASAASVPALPSAPRNSSKRRIQPILIKATHTADADPASVPAHDPDVLSVTLSSGLLSFTSSDTPSATHSPAATSIVHRFCTTPNAPTKLVSSHADLQLLLQDLTETCMATRDCWIRDPSSPWIQTLLSELSPAMYATVRRAHRKLNVNPAASVEERWFARSEFATKIIESWFDGKTLDQVIAKSRTFGQDHMPLGYVLTGEAVLRLGLNQNVSFEQLLPVLEAFLAETARDGNQNDGNEVKGKESSSSTTCPPPTPTKSVSVYRNSGANAFRTREDRLSLSELEACWKGGLSAMRGSGSLNTTFDYGSFTGDHTELPNCDMLHCFYRDMNELTEEGGVDAVELNQRLYLIWKFRDYATPHHQDTHIVPHFTLYSQTSGASVFHFLPVLVGLYVAYRGAKDPTELKRLLVRLDDMGMGSIGALGPGQLALIMPSGSHGVFVPPVDPYPGLNSRVCAPFDVSLIRAAEFILSPLRNELFSPRRLASHKWNTVLDVDEEEERLIRRFMKRQLRMIDGGEVEEEEVDIDVSRPFLQSREEWFWAAQQCWQRWEKDQAQPQEL